MTTLVWEVVEQVVCRRVAEPAQLLEQRIYPDDALWGAAASYQVRARRCSLGTECLEAGFPCRWTGLNPNYDPFAVSLGRVGD